MLAVALLYSKWIPDRGGYAYYETSERRGLGDDLPIPSVTPVNAIGAPSTEVGRTLPLGAKLVGYGPLARGSVVHLDRSGLSGMMDAGARDLTLWGSLAAFGATVGFYLVKKFS